MPKQKIEDAINEKLTGVTQKNALDFVSFLHANKIPPKLYVISVVGDGGKFPHIRPWVIFINVCEFDGLIDEVLAEFAWEHAHICDNFITGGIRCGCGRQPGSRKAIFGKEFENICHSPLQFINPDVKALESMKRLLLLLK